MISFKNRNKCSCGEELSVDGLFCSNCGRKNREINYNLSIPPINERCYYCNNCGFIFDYDAQFCYNCGNKRENHIAELQENNICSNCKKYLLNSDHYCGFCGWRTVQIVNQELEKEPLKKSELFLRQLSEFISSFSPLYCTLMIFFVLVYLLSLSRSGFPFTRPNFIIP